MSKILTLERKPGETLGEVTAISVNKSLHVFPSFDEGQIFWFLFVKSFAGRRRTTGKTVYKRMQILFVHEGLVFNMRSVLVCLLSA